MSKLYIIGSYEAVVEAAMHVRQADGLVGLMSDGVRSVDRHPGMFEFIGHCSSVAVGASAFSNAISKEFPMVVSGCSVLGIGFRDIRADQCVWGAAAYIDGTELFGGLTGSLPSSLPSHIRPQVDNSNSAGALPLACLPELHQLAYSRVMAEASARLPSVIAARSGAEARAGFHRWTPLTHAVAAYGMAGFKQGLRKPHVEGAPASAAQKLTHEAVAAQKAGVACWVDSLLYGSRVCDDVGALGEPAPLSDGDVARWGANHVALLTQLAKAPDSDRLASALLESLSSHRVSLQSGQHPLPRLLCAAVAEGADDVAFRGLRKLIGSAGRSADEYSEDHRVQSVLAVRKSGLTADSIRLAFRMGTSPGLLASKLLLGAGSTTGEKVLNATRLLDGLCEVYGSIKVFPEELTRAFVDAASPVASAFEALRTAAMMSDAIAQASGPSDAEAAPPVSARRRHSV